MTSGEGPQHGTGWGPAAGGQYPQPYGQPGPGVPYGLPGSPPPPPPFPGPYGQPYGYGFPYVPARRTNGCAIASMVLGILWLYWIGSVLALVLGYIARSQIRERGESGDGMAIAGIVLGWIGVGILALALVAGIGSSSV
jgi:hypothetical protein